MLKSNAADDQLAPAPPTDGVLSSGLFQMATGVQPPTKMNLEEKKRFLVEQKKFLAQFFPTLGSIEASSPSLRLEDLPGMTEPIFRKISDIKSGKAAEYLSNWLASEAPEFDFDFSSPNKEDAENLSPILGQLMAKLEEEIDFIQGMDDETDRVSPNLSSSGLQMNFLEPTRPFQLLPHSVIHERPNEESEMTINQSNIVGRVSGLDNLIPANQLRLQKKDSDGNQQSGGESFLRNREGRNQSGIRDGGSGLGSGLHSPSHSGIFKRGAGDRKLSEEGILGNLLKVAMHQSSRPSSRSPSRLVTRAAEKEPQESQSENQIHASGIENVKPPLSEDDVRLLRTLGVNPSVLAESMVARHVPEVGSAYLSGSQETVTKPKEPSNNVSNSAPPHHSTPALEPPVELLPMILLPDTDPAQALEDLINPMDDPSNQIGSDAFEAENEPIFVPNPSLQNFLSSNHWRAADSTAQRLFPETDIPPVVLPDEPIQTPLSAATPYPLPNPFADGPKIPKERRPTPTDSRPISLPFPAEPRPLPLQIPPLPDPSTVAGIPTINTKYLEDQRYVDRLLRPSDEEAYASLMAINRPLSSSLMKYVEYESGSKKEAAPAEDLGEDSPSVFKPPSFLNQPKQPKKLSRKIVDTYFPSEPSMEKPATARNRSNKVTLFYLKNTVKIDPGKVESSHKTRLMFQLALLLNALVFAVFLLEATLSKK
jgi:hypothetical protein